MREEQAIKKETIDNFLQANLDQYIETLIKELEKPQESFSRRELSVLQDLLIEIRRLLNNDSINLIITRLSTQNFSSRELSQYMDIDLKDKGEPESAEIIRRVIILLASKQLLRLQPLISTIFNKKNYYHVFLSHCSWDARETLGLKLILEYDYKLNAYVDWIDDKQANYPRAIKKIIDVIKSIAELKLDKIENIVFLISKEYLKENKESNKYISEIIMSKLKMSKSLFYIQSRHYDYSRWMPWEIGIAEASNKEIYRLPIKYIRTRKKFGKRSGFLNRYKSIITLTSNGEEKFKEEEMKKITK